MINNRRYIIILRRRCRCCTWSILTSCHNLILKLIFSLIVYLLTNISFLTNGLRRSCLSLNSFEICLINHLMLLNRTVHLLIWYSHSLVEWFMDEVATVGVLAALDAMVVLARITLRTCLSWLVVGSSSSTSRCCSSTSSSQLLSLLHLMLLLHQCFQTVEKQETTQPTVE